MGWDIETHGARVVGAIGLDRKANGVMEITTNDGVDEAASTRLTRDEFVEFVQQCIDFLR